MRASGLDRLIDATIGKASEDARSILIENGAVPFESIPIGGLFFWPGEYIASNERTGFATYRKPYGDPTTYGIRDVGILVYPDHSKYLTSKRED